MLVIQNTEGSESSFEVKSFIYEGALSECYKLNLEVLDVNDRLAGKTLCGQKAAFTYLGSTAVNETLSGIITRVQKQQDPIKLTHFYEIEIQPHLSLLSLARDLKVHNKQSFLEISQNLVNQLAQEYALSNYADFQVSLPWLTSALKTHDVQFEDSNLDYFNKILSFARYYFNQNMGGENLIIIDSPMLLPTREQNILFDPTRKEDLKDSSASFYSLNLQMQAQNLNAQPFYFDPKNPADSL